MRLPTAFTLQTRSVSQDPRQQRGGTWQVTLPIPTREQEVVQVQSTCGVMPIPRSERLVTCEVINGDYSLMWIASDQKQNK